MIFSFLNLIIMSASVFEVGMDADALVDKVLKEDDFPFSESLVLHPFDHHINCKVLRPSLDHIVNEKGDDMKEIIPSAINQILYEKGNNYVMSAIGDAGNIINADKILSGKGPFLHQTLVKKTYGSLMKSIKYLTGLLKRLQTMIIFLKKQILRILKRRMISQD